MLYLKPGELLGPKMVQNVSKITQLGIPNLKQRFTKRDHVCDK